MNRRPSPEPTRAELLTPPGRGAVAVIRASGSTAAAAVDHWFRPANGKPLAEQPVGAIRFGRWRDTAGEEVVVCRRSDLLIEVHCHGGRAASTAILADLASVGCPVSEAPGPGIEASRNTLAQQAWRALQYAPTERAAAVLLDQAQGALDREIQATKQAIEGGDLADAQDRVRQLLAHRRLAGRLIEPWRVVLVGPPNVGKSSLVNALLGHERAIVFDQPGTTRDVVTATTAIGGWPVRLSDTAGLRDSSDAIEAAGVAMTKQELASSDVVVEVQEASSWSGDASHLEHFPHHASIVRVASKVDLCSEPPDDQGIVHTSVVGPPGIEALLRAIDQAIGVTMPPAGQAVPFTGEQVEQLDRVATALDLGEAERAATALQALLTAEQGD